MNYKSPIQWGIVGGLISIVLSLLVYFVSPTSFASFKLVFVFVLLAIFLMIWGGINFRRDNHNTVSFVQAFIAVLIVGIIMSLISSVFSYILTTFIDPDLSELIKQKTIENTTEMMEKLGTPEDQLDEAIDKIRETNFNFGIKEYFFRFLQGSIMYVIFALIIAIFVKRNPDAIPQNPNA
jgi:hypothetical protein